jgi:hypothetical protein
VLFAWYAYPPSALRYCGPGDAWALLEYAAAGLLRAGYAVEPLRVLDSCRIRWGTVFDIETDHAVISAQPLPWIGSLCG